MKVRSCEILKEHVRIWVDTDVKAECLNTYLEILTDLLSSLLVTYLLFAADFS